MVILGVVILFIFATLNALPLTFLGMLFAGNIGLNYGFLDLLPGAMAVKIAVSSFITTGK